MAAAARTRFLQPNNRFISQMRTTTIQMSKDNQNAPHRQMKLHISDSARPARPLLPPRQARDPANADGRPPRNARPPHAVTGLPPAARGIPPRGREGAPHVPNSGGRTRSHNAKSISHMDFFHSKKAKRLRLQTGTWRRAPAWKPKTGRSIPKGAKEPRQNTAHTVLTDLLYLMGKILHLREREIS